MTPPAPPSSATITEPLTTTIYYFKDLQEGFLRKQLTFKMVGRKRNLRPNFQPPNWFIGSDSDEGTPPKRPGLPHHEPEPPYTVRKMNLKLTLP